MEPTDPSQMPSSARLTLERWLSGCWLVLPYVSYLALGGLALFLVDSLRHRGREILRLLWRGGWLWLTLGIGINVLISQAPGESALQSVNFWPFFVLFAAIATAIPTFKQPVTTLHNWALALLLATIPINLRAVVEFYLKSPANVQLWMGNSWFNWLYLQEDFGHRADSVFGHPNVFANYLVMVAGLGLGLSLYYLQQPKRLPLAPWVYASTVLCLVGVFCSGSRNGLMVAGVQVLIFSWLVRRYRYVVLAGFGALLAIVLGSALWGVGGRNLAEAFSTITLRFDVWQVAIAMIASHPWLGSGLGTFSLLYQPYTIPIYESLSHTHNLWLMLATEMGLPIALGFTLVVGWLAAKSMRALMTIPFSPGQRAILSAYGLGFIGNVMFAMFDLAFYDSRVNVLGWLMLAGVQAIPSLGPAPPPPSEP